MHDQSASQISGRTRAAVSAICVRALRITVLKSAGNFTRDECHDLNAEKIQRVKCFMLMRYGICCAWQFSNTGAAGWVRKFQAMVNWRKWRFTSPCPVYPRKQTPIGRVGMSARCQPKTCYEVKSSARPTASSARWSGRPAGAIIGRRPRATTYRRYVPSGLVRLPPPGAGVY